MLQIHGKTPEAQRAEQQAEVAQGDVVIAGDAEKIHDDTAQPSRNHECTDGGSEEDQESGCDFDHADHKHEVGRRAREDVVHPRRQVDGPVHQQVRELIETKDNWRDCKSQSQEPEGLLNRGKTCSRLPSTRDCSKSCQRVLL